MPERQSDSVLREQRAAAAPGGLGTTRSTPAGCPHPLPILTRMCYSEITCRKKNFKHASTRLPFHELWQAGVQTWIHLGEQSTEATEVTSAEKQVWQKTSQPSQGPGCPLEVPAVCLELLGSPLKGLNLGGTNQFQNIGIKADVF